MTTDYYKEWAKKNPEKRRASRRNYEETKRKPARKKAGKTKEDNKYF